MLPERLPNTQQEASSGFQHVLQHPVRRAPPRPPFCSILFYSCITYWTSSAITESVQVIAAWRQSPTPHVCPEWMLFLQLVVFSTPTQLSSLGSEICCLPSGWLHRRQSVCNSPVTSCTVYSSHCQKLSELIHGHSTVFGSCLLKFNCQCLKFISPSLTVLTDVYVVR